MKLLCRIFGHKWYLNAVRADRLVYCCDRCYSHKEDFDPDHREAVLRRSE